jgi:SAM-dependent methyltransferase
MSLGYNALISEAYSHWYASRDAAERDFYASFLRKTKGVALEIACGSGQLLIFYMKAGYAVEGFDASQAMLDIAYREAKKEHLSLALSCQTMEELSLGKSYTLLYGPFGALHHVEDKKSAQQALRNFYAHTTSGGTLLLHFLVPPAQGFNRDLGMTHQAVRGDGATLSTYGKSSYDTHTKMMVSHVRITVSKDNKVIDETRWIDRLRLYDEAEVSAMIEEAGYVMQRIHRRYGLTQDEHAPMFIIEAIKP